MVILNRSGKRGNLQLLMEKPFLSFGVILLRSGRVCVCRLCKWPFLNFPVHSQVLLLFNGKSFVVVRGIKKSPFLIR